MAAKPPPDGENALPHLHLHSEKLLLSPIQPHLLSYCPTMDLIALVTAEQNLDVYRINGQKAFSLKRKSDDDVIDALCWQYNGRNIAVSWSDGSTDIVSAESGKVVHGNLRVGAGDERVVRMGWGVNFIETDGVKRRTGVKKRKGREKQGTESTPAKKKETDNDTSIDFIGKETTEDWDAFKDDVTLEDFLQRQPDLQYLEIAPDLPDQLAMMDMETLLPKLPAIPMPPALPFMRAPQAASGAFSSQIEVDSLLHSHHLKDHNSVDIFIRCTDKGTVHPSIYDSLETINVELPSAWNIQSTPILHTSHPYSCHHGLVLQTTNPASPDDHKLSFVPLKLNFIPSAGIYLHLIASKTSQLQNLLLYITQTLQRIHTFWKHSQDLPSKFMMNISETLEEKGQGDLVSNLFHLACTGNCTPVLREWLVDELAEQGHKRWDNAVTSGLTTLLSLVHENFLPALDRCSIVISRLRGLAQFHDQSWIFNGPITDFTMLLELLKNLRLLGHTVLLYASDEKKQFLSFSKWLRFCIDFEATEPGSQSRAEMEGRDPGVDIGMVLEYIQYPLTKSDLTPHLRPSAQLSGHQKVKEPASYDDTKKAIELLKEGAHYKEEALCLEHVLKHFEHGVTKLLKQVGQWQQTNSSMDCGIVLEEGDIDNATVDMRMVFEVKPLFLLPSPPSKKDKKNPSSSSSTSKVESKSKSASFQTTLNHLNRQLSQLSLTQPQESSNPNDITTYIAISPQSSSSSESSSHLYIHRFTHEPTISTLPKDLTTYATTTLDFAPCDAKILDVKFADDKSLLILLHLSSSSSPNASTHPYALVSLPYTPISTTTSYHSPSTTHFIPYNPIPTSTQSTALLPSGTPVTPSIRTTLPITPTLLQTHTRHVFEARFAPLKMIVNGRKGRRVVVVLGKDRKCFRVLDMDFKGRKKDRGGEGNGEEGGNEGEEDEESSSDSEEEGNGFGDGDVEMGGA